MDHQQILTKYQLKALQREGEFYYYLLDELFNRFKHFKSFVEIHNIQCIEILIFIHEVSLIIDSLETTGYTFKVQSYTSDYLCNLEMDCCYFINDPYALMLYTDIEFRLNNYESQSMYLV